MPDAVLLLLGFAAGVMGVASIAGLLIPACEEGSALAIIGGLAVGASLLGVVRWKLSPRVAFMGHADSGARTSALVFLVLFVHSLPEGFAIGTAFASDRAGLSLFVILAIAIQNIPERTSVAIPMAASGFSRSRQFWAAIRPKALARSAGPGSQRPRPRRPGRSRPRSHAPCRRAWSALGLDYDHRPMLPGPSERIHIMRPPQIAGRKPCRFSSSPRSP